MDVLGIRALATDHDVVVTRLTGNFPGGTVDVANQFWLRDGLIAKLEIAPPDDEESYGSPPS